MKTLFRPLLLSMAIITSTYCFGQKSETHLKLFSDFPEKINFSENILKNTFSSSAGKYLSIDFGSGFIFRGIVTSNLRQSKNLQTVVMKVENFSNSTFAVSKILNQDGSNLIVGRILNLQAVDGYELRRNANGTYFLQKLETEKIVQVCKFVD